MPNSMLHVATKYCCDMALSLMLHQIAVIFKWIDRHGIWIEIGTVMDTLCGMHALESVRFENRKKNKRVRF